MAWNERKLVQAYPCVFPDLCCVYTTDQQEYAGLPGSSPSAHFFKSISQSQLSRQLYAGSNIVRLLRLLTPDTVYALRLSLY